MANTTYQLLNRITYGPRKEDIRRLNEMGWEAYAEEQLDPGAESTELEAMIKGQKFSWRFDLNGKSTKVEAPISFYEMSIKELFSAFRIGTNTPLKHEIRRPFFETLIISWLKALYSPWQLRELMVEFWHNHFTVSADIEDGIAACMADYDRKAIRPHVFGNFRNMLEAVTKAPAMLHYLDNAVSRASPANENFARELFELHTLGEENYFNHLYDDWSKVPGALDGLAQGYIDEDVYEAARAFSGWTVAWEPYGERFSVPNSGEFYYFDPWHDPYKKRVLGVELKSQQGPMEDGLQVLDLVAHHPGTAHFLCTKLCRWLVADHPPESVVAKAVETWTREQHSPHQIRETLKTILLSPELKEHLGAKLKRPNHLVFAFVRMTGAQLTPHESVFWWNRQMGYHQFTCPFPTGNPDEAAFWLNSDAMLKRWQSFPKLEEVGTAEGFFAWDILQETPSGIEDFEDLLGYWSGRLIDQSVPHEIKRELRKIYFEDLDKVPLGELRSKNPEVFASKTKQMVRLLCMSPEFQYR